jgi:hypothetical protein
MNDPPSLPVPSTTPDASAQSPSPSPRKSLSTNNAFSGSPSNSVDTDSRSSTPRQFTRKNNKTSLRSSFSALNKSPGPSLSLDVSGGELGYLSNTFPNLSLHSSRETKTHLDPSFEDNDEPNGILPDPQNPNHRHSLPKPLPPPRCPLLCVFYAEFDIVVGPIVCFQSPSKFMSFDINVGQNEINQSLEETFEYVMKNHGVNIETNTKQRTGSLSKIGSDQNMDLDDYWNWSTEEAGNISEAKSHDADISSQSTHHTFGNKSHRRRNTDGVFADHLHTATTLGHSPSFTPSKGVSLHEDSTVDSETLQNSIFAACSEYIITGNELANQTITVSTRGMHILSRPMIISDTKRYERNSLLFSVGFVLRRDIDPRPWWPVLSSLSRTFRAMEVESEFLSHQRTRPMIQTVLADVLVSLNSKQIDCHLVLDEGNLLNLQLFQPPHLPTPPVPDYAVPILLRPEWQLQLYDWDLTINWILPHIDGCRYVKQIAQSSEVDMELVRSCLRVLKHHGVLSYVDVFRYANIYECTPHAQQLLSPILDGEDSIKGKKVIDEGFWYAIKRKFARQAPSKIYKEMLALTSIGNSNSPGSFSSSPLMNSVVSRRYSQPMIEDFEPRSFPNQSHRASIAEESTSDESIRFPKRRSDNIPKSTNQMSSFLRDADATKQALTSLYCACNRDKPLGGILLSKIGPNSDDAVPDANKRNESSMSSLDSSNMAPLYKSTGQKIYRANSQDTSSPALKHCDLSTIYSE